MPTFALFKNGNKLSQFEGANMDRLTNEIAQHDTFASVYYSNAKQLIDRKLAFTQNEVTLKTLASVITAIVSHPNEEKYRSLKTTNEAIKQKLGSVDGAYAFLEAIGFEKQGELYTLPVDRDVTEEYTDILELVKKQQAHTAKMAKLALDDAKSVEAKKQFLEEKNAKLREERRLQAEEKKKLSNQVKNDHRSI
jgi:heme exporter protein D